LARVTFTSTFVADLGRRTAYLATAEEWSRLDHLAEDVAGLREQLARFPGIGRELTRDRGQSLRRVAVGRLPYFVWYLWDPRGDGIVEVQRIFHTRQHAAPPRIPPSRLI
jgi:plasmid stabilization system protein ParE